MTIATLAIVALSIAVAVANDVVVETIKEGTGPAVTRDHRYSSHVTLYIEQEDGTRTPSGWSTRVEDGAKAAKPFQFKPFQGLIQGWSEGVVQMKEGERALLHIPSAKGYGSSPMGSKGGAFWIPANSNLLFDLEVLGKATKAGL